MFEKILIFGLGVPALLFAILLGIGAANTDWQRVAKETKMSWTPVPLPSKKNLTEEDAQRLLAMAYARDMTNPKTADMARVLMARCANGLGDPSPLELLECYGR